MWTFILPSCQYGLVYLQFPPADQALLKCQRNKQKVIKNALCWGVLYLKPHYMKLLEACQIVIKKEKVWPYIVVVLLSDQFFVTHTQGIEHVCLNVHVCSRQSIQSLTGLARAHIVAFNAKNIPHTPFLKLH